MLYILNPGDWHDVVTFGSVHDAWKALDVARKVDPCAKLFLHSEKLGWQVYSTEGNTWYGTNMDVVPIKVLECIGT